MRLLSIVALFVSVGLSGCSTVHTEIVIPAPPQAVWEVLTDASGYAAWNPVFVQADGRHVQGDTVTYVMRTPDGTRTEVAARVARAEPQRELNQRGGTWGVLTFDHQWLLEPVSNGTRVVQHEEYRGIGVWFWDESWVTPAYQRANEALKARVLALSSSTEPRDDSHATDVPPEDPQ